MIKSDQLDSNTARTPGMNRAAAIDAARVGAQQIWAGTVTIDPDAKTGAHHHGALESVIYIVRGRARMRWGDHLEFVAEAEPGDFIFVPPYVPPGTHYADLVVSWRPPGWKIGIATALTGLLGLLQWAADATEKTRATHRSRTLNSKRMRRHRLSPDRRNRDRYGQRRSNSRRRVGCGVSAQEQRSATGTSPRTCSMCPPQPW
ncbi:cupin domain-containing protein [Nocardia sp. NBC_01503]|uniref:hypothetical protein n=1 Tax=Nocardia sp. NBC_01503 TaxID=2975997 RepID=UPI002E7AEEA3|nr:hypothetical protein [Nocardia sp. NBC_01503]WTL36597.1 cupin domain-containing protein [Nocardia sp. NBC_01503]